jgi:hypothetical protein
MMQIRVKAFIVMAIQLIAENWSSASHRPTRWEVSRNE